MITAQDKQLISAFTQNSKMFEVVRDVLLTGILGENYGSKNWVLDVDRSQSDAAFGEEVKLKGRALELIDSGLIGRIDIGGSPPSRPFASLNRERTIYTRKRPHLARSCGSRACLLLLAKRTSRHGRPRLRQDPLRGNCARN
jgi:hypothetical protein